MGRIQSHGGLRQLATRAYSSLAPTSLVVCLNSLHAAVWIEPIFSGNFQPRQNGAFPKAGLMAVKELTTLIVPNLAVMNYLHDHVSYQLQRKLVVLGDGACGKVCCIPI